MFALLMTLFVVVTFFLAIFVLLQQGKGDGLGLGVGAGTQMLFGGSGGKNFFEKVTWVLGAVFILGALGLSILKAKMTRSSRLASVVSQKAQQPKQQDVEEAVEDLDNASQDAVESENN